MGTPRFDTNRALPRVSPPNQIEGGDAIQVAGANLSTNFSTTAVAPSYTTLLSASLTALEPASFLDIIFYAALDHTGGGVGATRRVNARLRLNGVLIVPSRACSENQLTDQNFCIMTNRRVAISGGVQLVTVEVAFNAVAGATIRVQPATRPDQHGATLRLRETL